MSEKQQGFSAADEILKLKKLLDDGVLTQEEFDKQKAQLLGLRTEQPAKKEIPVSTEKAAADPKDESKAQQKTASQELNVVSDNKPEMAETAIVNNHGAIDPKTEKKKKIKAWIILIAFAVALGLIMGSCISGCSDSDSVDETTTTKKTTTTQSEEVTDAYGRTNTQNTSIRKIAKSITNYYYPNSSFASDDALTIMSWDKDDPSTVLVMGTANIPDSDKSVVIMIISNLQDNDGDGNYDSYENPYFALEDEVIHSDGEWDQKVQDFISVLMAAASN